MSWTWRVLWRRSRAQQALLAPVLAVAIVGATLLGSFLLLLTTSEHTALDAALDRADPAATQVDLRLSLVNTGRGPSSLAHGTAALDELVGPVPTDRSAWLASGMYEVTGTQDPRRPYVYAAAYPAIADHSRLRSGAFPTAPTDASGRLQVALPQAAADAYGWHVGSVVTTVDQQSQHATTFVVTGTFDLDGPASLWGRDPLGGATHDPAYPVIGAAGVLTTQAWGPLVTSADAFTSGAATLSTADLIVAPRFASASATDIAALRDRLGVAQQSAAAATKSDFTGALVVTTLPATITDAVSALQVTRVGLVIVGLMLVVLAVTVLLLAARLLAERRAAEQTLMASRGAGGHQILGLAALESLGVAAVTTLVAPWLATLLYVAVTSAGPLERAGLHHDPGRPLALWLTCAAASVVLAGVLLGPVLRRPGSVVDAEQQLVRQDRRGGLARTGADLALVALAALALYQLRSYHSPVVAGVGGLGSLDPVLVAAPALVLLAGAVLALRVLPLVAGVGERLAARSRSLVGPLAAWEVRRRPARAASAVLLLTLVVGVGAFSQAFLATWRDSQQDQAELATGTDVRVTPQLGTPLEVSAQLDAVPGVRRAAPVLDREVVIGSQSHDDGVSTTLVALDTTHAGDLLRGRVDGPGWAATTAQLATSSHLAGVALPGEAADLVLDASAATTPVLQGAVYLTLVVQDRDGATTAIDLPRLRSTGAVRDLVVPLPATATGLRIVGVKGALAPGDADGATLAATPGDVSLAVTLENLRVVQRGGLPADLPADTVPRLDQIDPAHLAPAPIAGAPWTAVGIAVADDAPSLVTLTKSPTRLVLRDAMSPARAASGGQGFVAVSTTTSQAAAFRGIPALATPGLLASFGGEVGDILTVDVDGVPVRVAVVGTIAHLPGEPRTDGLLADHAAIARQVLLGAGTGSLADQWWLQVPDDRAHAAVVALTAAGVGDAVARVDARADATSGPLHIGVQAALWIVTMAAVGLAVAGFALSATVSVRTRRLELARLQAVGASRRGLVRSVLVEYAILAVLGLAGGLGLGALLGRLVAPTITVSGSGATPVPPVLVRWPWVAQGALVAAVVVLVATTVAVTANALLRRASGELLRLGDER